MKKNIFDEVLINYCNKIYCKKLSEMEIIEIKENLLGFFSILLEIDNNIKNND